MKALALALATLAGACVSVTRVGPYVKHVSRNGDWLVVHKCIIVLDGNSLAEEGCTVEQLPLGSVPQAAPPPVQPPAAPPR